MLGHGDVCLLEINSSLVAVASSPNFSFHCLFCHGYEERNVDSAGVLAIGELSNPHAVQHLARMARRLTPKVTVYTDGSEDLAQEVERILVDDDMKVERRKIARLEKGPDTTVDVYFDDGEKVTEGFLVSKALPLDT